MMTFHLRANGVKIWNSAGVPMAHTPLTWFSPLIQAKLASELVLQQVHSPL